MNAHIKFLKEALEHSPVNPTVNPDLIGWWIKQPDGDYFICSHCAARLLGRGVSIGQSAPVWKDKAEPYGVCSMECGK